MERTADLYLLNAAELEPAAPRYLPLLTPSRRKAAEQYRDRLACLRVIAAGLLLYKVLGVRDDADLTFNEFGKPLLAAGGPQFSLSYAGRYAALAVAPFCIGVDIEPVEKAYPRILRSCFHSEELEWLDEKPGSERFYTLWTRLESALKARGTGFACKERTFSLLDDSPLFFINAVCGGHMVSCAAEGRFMVRQTDMPVDILPA